MQFFTFKFKLPKSVTYKDILSQHKLNTIKHRSLVQALTFVFQGYPNYISDMFRVKNCAYNLCGIGSRLNQPAPNTALKHK